MIYILARRHSLTEFLFCDVDGVEPLLLPAQKVSLFTKVIRRLQLILSQCFKLNLFHNYFSKEINRKLKNLTEYDSLVYIGEEDPKICFMLSRLCKSVQSKAVFFWNSCVTIKSCEKKIKKMKSYGFKIATFDRGDAEKFDLHFANQIYRKIQKPNCSEIKNDFFFCGLNKGRKNKLLKIRDLLTPIGSCKFIIPEIKDAMLYPNYLEEVKRARVLLDICQNGQSGLTLRVLESLFWGKKLITDNVFVKKCDFFNPSNILLFNENTTRADVVDFLSKPFVPYEESLLKKYMVENVLKDILND